MVGHFKKSMSATFTLTIPQKFLRTAKNDLVVLPRHEYEFLKRTCSAKKLAPKNKNEYLQLLKKSLSFWRSSADDNIF
jgi:hypothetical protein